MGTTDNKTTLTQILNTIANISVVLLTALFSYLFVASSKMQTDVEVIKTRLETLNERLNKFSNLENKINILEQQVSIINYKITEHIGN